MTPNILCYRCGASLVDLTFPLSRFDECPSCTIPLRVCRMCQFYDPGVLRKCTEDDAEEVKEKERLNFCDWFRPGEGCFDANAASKDKEARTGLATLFGECEPGSADSDPALQDAEELFK